MDYKATLNLPKTDFPMKANLPKLEPEWLDRWAAMDIYGRIRQASANRPRWILHDGPPYANGKKRAPETFATAVMRGSATSVAPAAWP